MTTSISRPGATVTVYTVPSGWPVLSGPSFLAARPQVSEQLAGEVIDRAVVLATDEVSEALRFRDLNTEPLSEAEQANLTEGVYSLALAELSDQLPRFSSGSKDYDPEAAEAAKERHRELGFAKLARIAGYRTVLSFGAGVLGAV